jgi:pyruvate formate-lyase/glycerol dehydratase family glycyl radical enzyme
MPVSTVYDETSKGRIERLKREEQNCQPGICPERALIWTWYHRKRENRKKPSHVRMAEALSSVLERKSIEIYPGELIVGNFTSRRVGGSIFPELHGVPVLLDLLRFLRRETNPLDISNAVAWKLARIVPFWMFRFVAFRAYRSPFKKIRLIADQLKAHYYLINEAGGISHFAPNYRKLIESGANGLFREAAARQNSVTEGTEQWNFYEGVKTIAEGFARFGERYAGMADRMARKENDPARREELERIASHCRRVPRFGARTFHEAVQSLFFAQVALNQESLDNSICPGRMDQYLYPYYASDVKRGLLTRGRAKEILACFSIKMSEIVPVFSKHLTNFHGGMFNGQVVTVGGLTPDGKDGTNELTWIFLEVMDELRMRQPNYHARIHANSPETYVGRITKMLAGGSNSPALYCDEVIIDTMVKNGYSIEDARDYTAVGCVEPVSQGRSFSSTDAAIFNVPLILEISLNGGRRFGHFFRSGIKTVPLNGMNSSEELYDAFRRQLGHRMSFLIRDLRAIEMANRLHHPTPLTSMLIDGCLEKGDCSTAGGARYNFSGIQCVAPADTGDALYAVNRLVFQEKKLGARALVQQLGKNIADERIQALLRSQDKFGNDNEEVDRHVQRVIKIFAEELAAQGKNTRGGRYVMGLYSVTAHEYFGRITGALPNGRRKGQSFASGVAPENGMDRLGPTAMLNSVNRIDFTHAGNGINLNAMFDPHSLRGQEGLAALQAMLRIYFRRGGMQIQVNVIDPSVLIEARDNPEAYPNLLVRVSGYSAYFNDLTPGMKDEIIRRSLHRC